jgi:hypothetical protein
MAHSQLKSTAQYRDKTDSRYVPHGSFFFLKFSAAKFSKHQSMFQELLSSPLTQWKTK